MSSKKFSWGFLSLVIVAILVLSACGPAAKTATPVPAKSTEVEVFSWWVGPGEADGLAAMVKVFNAQYPNIKFINAAVAGGAGTNAKAVLATRLAAGDAPDSWQAHAGQETIANYVAAGQVKPLDDLFESTGFDKVLPATLLPLISQDGHPYSVPVNIHRSNVLWYNPKVLAAAGVTANPKTDFKTLDDFFAACDKIKAAGKICLSLGAPWTAIHLFENIMIGTMGADKWNGLWTTPPTTDWAGADVAKGIANFAKALSYTNPDASTLSDWQTPSKMMTDGDAAFNIMGDWAYGYFANAAPNGLALTPHTDFDWAVSPGTYGVFNFLVRQLRAARRRQAPGCYHCLVDRRRFQGRSGSLQPAQGLHLRPHRLQSSAVQRILAGCSQGLDQQCCGRQPDAWCGCRSCLGNLDRDRHRSVPDRYEQDR